jgi:diaminopimelate decarboxylase
VDRLERSAIAPILQRAIAQGHLSADCPSLILHDLGRLDARLADLRASFPPGSLHAVAIKANPLVEVLRFCVERGAGLEAASYEEVALARAAECPPDRIVYDSPAKTISDLERALRLGVRINIDNMDELARIAALREEIPSESRIGMRVNPLVGEGRIRATSVAGPGSKFGLPLVAGDRSLIDAFARHDWLTGLHVHVGSQGCDVAQMVEAVRRLHGLRTEIHRSLGREQVRSLDLGGGLPVAYRPEDRPPSFAEYAQALRDAVPGLMDPGLELVTEFGRHLQANAGWAVSRVEYVKRHGEHRLAVVHLGADFLVRRAYRPEDWYHELQVFDAAGVPKSSEVEPWTIAGPLCFSGDVLGRDLPLPAIEPGDWLVIRDVGAYTLGMWSRYCSRRIPPVLGYDGSETFRVLREGEEANDLVAFWSRSRP